MWHAISCLKVSLCSFHCLRVCPWLCPFHRLLRTSSCSSFHLSLTLLLLLLQCSFQALWTWSARLCLTNFWGFGWMLECRDLFLHGLSIVCHLSLVEAIIWKWPCSLYHIVFLLCIAGCLGKCSWSYWPVRCFLHCFGVYVHLELMLNVTWEVLSSLIIALTIMIGHWDSHLLNVLLTSFVFLVWYWIYIHRWC